MSHLVALSVGPVQEFIQAARRTRDLFTGSRLLSEISKAAALAMEQAGAKLVFPAADSDLAEGSDFSVANIILAEFHDSNPAGVVDSGKKAARDYWAKIAGEARRAVDSDRVIRADVWNAQVNDVVELFGSWCVVGTESVGGRTPYQIARDHLMRLMAGRKSLRDFRQPTAFARLPKSSLDGQRDTVLQEDRRHWPAGIRWQLRAKPGEQLDSVGVIKRVWEGRRPFPSVSRVAADSWLRGIQPEDLHLLEELSTACDRGIRGNGLELSRLGDQEFSRYSLFPFEGGALYQGRHGEFTERYGTVPESVDMAVKSLEAALAPLVKKYREPDPYVAVLVADGDRMGEALSRISDPNGHRIFSRALAGFASNAREIVEKHQGSLVYSGGDDVLAILPVDQCLPCARSLALDFRTKLVSAVPVGVAVPTLSVGIGLGHSVEDLEDLLNYARAAEKHAKNPQPGEGQSRNGLAVHVHKRGGGPVRVRENWNLEKPEKSLDVELTTIAELINSKDDCHLPNRFASELVVLAREYTKWPGGATTAEAIHQDVRRVLRKKAGKISDDSRMAHFLNQLVDSASVQRLAEKILVARQIAVGMRMAKGENRRCTSR